MKRKELKNRECFLGQVQPPFYMAEFQIRDGESPEQNLAEFIRIARDELTVYGIVDWGHWHWKGIGMFLKHGCPRRVGMPGDWLLHPEFADFAKAYMRHEQGMNPTSKGGGSRLMALRAIEHALTRERGSGAPVDIGLATLDHAAQTLREYFAKGSAYTGGQQLMHLAGFLSRHGLTHNDTGTWRNPISYPAEIHAQLGAEADAHRRSKLPDMTALNAIGAIFSSGLDLTDNTDHPDVYATSVIAMLMAQPGRIGEIHELRIDLEIEQQSLDGSVQYGFRYSSEKMNQGTCIKWVPTVWAALAKEAVRRIREITDRPRALAHYLEEQLAAREKDPSSPLRFYRHVSCPNVADDESLTCEQAAAALGCRGGKLASKAFLLQRLGTSRRGAHTLNSLWLHVLERLPQGFPYIDGVGNKRLKYSDALFCMHANQLKKGVSIDPVSLWIPSLSTLAPMLAPSARTIESIFQRHNMTGDQGHPLRMNSHQLRHLLNTLGHEGSGVTFIDKDTINWWSGRDSAWQGVTYNHVPVEEIARRTSEALKNNDGSYAVIELPTPVPTVASPAHWSVTRPTSKSCADIEIHHRSAVLMTIWGGCEHDWLLEPCQFHQDCLNCKEHFCVKGFGKDDLERIGRLRELLSKVIHQQSLAKVADDAGEYGAASYYAYQTSYRERIEQLIALLINQDVTEGAMIRLAGAPANSHLHRVLKEVALRELIETSDKKDIVDALVLAYRENWTLPSNEIIAATIGEQ